MAAVSTFGNDVYDSIIHNWHKIMLRATIFTPVTSTIKTPSYKTRDDFRKHLENMPYFKLFKQTSDRRWGFRNFKYRRPDNTSAVLIYMRLELTASPLVQNAELLGDGEGSHFSQLAADIQDNIFTRYSTSLLQLEVRVYGN